MVEDVKIERLEKGAMLYTLHPHRARNEASLIERFTGNRMMSAKKNYIPVIQVLFGRPGFEPKSFDVESVECDTHITIVPLGV